MKKILLFTVLLASLLAPGRAHAEDCGSWICLGQILGFTDAAKINAERDAKEAETQRLQQTEIARINAARDQALTNAQIDIERQRQAGLLSVAQAQALAQQYQAQVDAWQRTQQSIIEQKYETQRSALSDQTQLGLSAIQETGQTQRVSMAMGTLSSAVVLILITVIVLYLSRLASRRHEQTAIYIAGVQHPQLDESAYCHRIDATSYQVVKKEPK